MKNARLLFIVKSEFLGYNGINVTTFGSNPDLPHLHQAYLCGGPGSEFELDPGYYEYPFQFTLPPDLPSSFEGSHGKVRYGDPESVSGFISVR